MSNIRMGVHLARREEVEPGRATQIMAGLRLTVQEYAVELFDTGAETTFES